MSRTNYFTPVPHGGTDCSIPNGWGGTKPLPAMRVPRGWSTAWVPTRDALKVLRRGGAISLVITQGAYGIEVSMEAAEVKLT